MQTPMQNMHAYVCESLDVNARAVSLRESIPLLRPEPEKIEKQRIPKNEH